MTQNELQNRYAALSQGGLGLVRLIRRLRLILLHRPHREILGADTFVQRPFYCSMPGHVKIGQRCTIRMGLRIQPLGQWFEQRFSPSITIGDDVYIGANCEIVAVGDVKIGSRCTLSDNVYINDSSHGLNPDDGLIMDRPLVTKGGVKIGDGCFIGRGVVILSGVEIGDDSVIGANSVITSSMPSHTMAVGNPAKIVARYDTSSKKWQRLNRSGA